MGKERGGRERERRGRGVGERERELSVSVFAGLGLYCFGLLTTPPSLSLFSGVQGSSGAEAQGTSHGASRGMAMAGGPPQAYMTSGHPVIALWVHT